MFPCFLLLLKIKQWPWVNNWLDSADIPDNWDERYFRCKGVNKQQLSIGSIFNCHFMEVFPLYMEIKPKTFNYQDQPVAVSPLLSYHKNIKAWEIWTYGIIRMYITNRRKVAYLYGT